MVIRQSRFNTYDSAKAKHSNTVNFPAPCDPSSISTSQFNHNKHKPNTSCNPQSYCNPGAIPTSTRNSCTKRPGNIEPGEGHREAASDTQSRLSPDITSHHAKKVVHPNGSCPDRHTSTTNTNMTCNHQSPVINCARIALGSAFLTTLPTLAHQVPPTNPFNTADPIPIPNHAAIH